MSRSRNVNAYPIDLVQLVEGVLLQRKVVTIPCKDKKERDALRRQIYGLRAALMATPTHPLALLGAKLTTRQEANNDLLLCHLDDVPLPEGVSLALAQLGGA